MTIAIVEAKRVERAPTPPPVLTPAHFVAQQGRYSMRDWRFSWDKREGMFHLREGDLNLYVVGLEGYTEILDADGQTGRITMRHALTMDDLGNATFENDQAASKVESDAPDQQMCFNRNQNKWRIWAKATPQEKRTVDGYKGPAYVYKPRTDRGHIFAKTHFEVIDGLVVFG